MSFFGAIGRALTGPVRGIANLVQGKFKKAIGSFADTAKVAAPFATLIPGVGPLAAIGINAATGAADAWANGGGNVGKVLTGGLTGAATGLAGEAMGGGVKLPFLGGGGAASALNPALGAAAEGAAGGSTLGNIGKFLSKNLPSLAALAGTAADVYGASKMGGIEDRELQLRQEELEKRRQMDQLGMLMNFTSGMRGRY